jgi:hypothetical protein
VAAVEAETAATIEKRSGRGVFGDEFPAYG